MPTRSLSGKGAEIRGHFCPAHGIGNKLYAVVRTFVPQVSVQPRYQIEIFADGEGLVASHGTHQIGSKDSECSRNDHQHVAACPCLSSNQEGAQILDHLDNLNALSRQPHSADSACFDL